MKLEPLNDRVVIELIPESRETESGLLLPENSQETSQTGKIIAVGDGIYQGGEKIPMRVSVGNIVLFPRYSGVEARLGRNKVLIVRESEILAIVR